MLVQAAGFAIIVSQTITESSTKINSYLSDKSIPGGLQSHSPSSGYHQNGFSVVVLEGPGCALGVFYPSSRGRNFGKFGTQILPRALCVLLIRVEEQSYPRNP